MQTKRRSGAAGRERRARNGRSVSVVREANGDVHVAVILAGDELCFITVAASRAGVVRRVVEYVSERAPLQLWPDDAQRVDALLAAGRAEDAVAHYFASSGGRWDHERMIVRTVPAV